MGAGSGVGGPLAVRQHTRFDQNDPLDTNGPRQSRQSRRPRLDLSTSPPAVQSGRPNRVTHIRQSGHGSPPLCGGAGPVVAVAFGPAGLRRYSGCPPSCRWCLRLAGASDPSNPPMHWAGSAGPVCNPRAEGLHFSTSAYRAVVTCRPCRRSLARWLWANRHRLAVAGSPERSWHCACGVSS